MAQGQDSIAILVKDHRPDTDGLWRRALEGAGAELSLAADERQALALADQTIFDLVFIWDDPPQAPADNLLLRLLDLFPEMVVTVAAHQPPLARAVEAVRQGAFNYVDAGGGEEALAGAARQALEYRRLRREKASRRQAMGRRYDVENIVGQSPAMQEVFRLIHKVAATDATVLILGESGTGKELVARAVHHHSSRSQSPLVPVNCGAIPEELLESELFGHEKGAFTGAVKSRPGRFELAEGGTIFLDEIGDMSPMLQVKLLRVLQEHQFERVGGSKTIDADIRVLAATHQDLAAKVEQGTFREDLFYRLNVVPIRVPPLRERRSDIPLLCQHFLDRLARQKALGRKSVAPEVMERLVRYGWPGNVRELENMLERMVILAEGDEVLLEDLPPRLAQIAVDGPVPSDAACQPAAAPLVPDEGLDFNQAVDAFERHLILQALERTGWVKNRAASLLSLNRTTLVEKIKKKGLSPEAGGQEQA